MSTRMAWVLLYLFVSQAAFAVTEPVSSPSGKAKLTWEDKLPEPDPEELKLEGETKTVEGLVTGAGYNGLAVELARKMSPKDPDEIWFNYVKGLELSGIKRLADLREGDTVKAVYKEAGDGRRILQKIVLIRKKPEEPADGE